MKAFPKKNASVASSRRPISRYETGRVLKAFSVSSRKQKFEVPFLELIMNWLTEVYIFWLFFMSCHAILFLTDATKVHFSAKNHREERISKSVGI